MLFLEYDPNERTFNLRDFKECRWQPSRDALPK